MARTITMPDVRGAAALAAVAPALVADLAARHVVGELEQAQTLLAAGGEASRRGAICDERGPRGVAAWLAVRFDPGAGRARRRRG